MNLPTRVTSPTVTRCAGIVVGLCVIASITACASSPAGGPMMEENPVIHTATAEDLATTKGKEPVDGSSVMLWVNGLGCPQCASNIDFQLKRVRGVSDVYTDLGTGKVTVSLAGGRNPTPDRLNDAVLDAGMTLVKLEAVK